MKTGTQMSDSFLTAAFLALSGGLQDAYSYCARGKVFANAQTGNIVLLSQRLFERDWSGAAAYFVPLCAFAMGVFVADQIRYSGKNRFHWRQTVLLAEILLLFAVGFMPKHLDFLANAIVSFSCAMQVQAFRKVNGFAYASTMCIGNLRSGMEAVSAYCRTRDRGCTAKAKRYFGVIFLFGLGAAAGGALMGSMALKTIWVCCILLFVSFFLMAMQKHEET